MDDQMGRRVVEGRAAFDRRAWADGYEALQAAAAFGTLDPEDLERLAIAAHLTGRSETAIETLGQLHYALLEAGETRRAVRWAVWLTLMLLQTGLHSRAGGWLSRAENLLVEEPPDCPERGFVLVPGALRALFAGDRVRAEGDFREVLAIARRCDDPDLAVLGVLGLGQALVASGEVERGVALLDEAMVAVTTAGVTPIMTGIAYCAVIITCRSIFDVRRAQEWTAELSEWCSGQQDLRPYRGQCLVHRSEIMQLRGEWPEAMEEVERACGHLSGSPGDPVLGMARYQQAELLRLQGRFAQAEQAYRESSDFGHPTHPGLALLRLAQGRVADALAAISREAEAAEGDRVRRSQVLAAEVEILLAAGEVEAAAEGVDELETIAAAFRSAYLEALAAQSRGEVLLAAGDAGAACITLRRAWLAWQQLDAPYEAARVRLLLAQACRCLGDRDTADLELDAALRVFEQLGAVPALARALEMSAPNDAAPPGGLTPRELEVLQQVATGATNRQIADRLVISEKTVARHLSNIFTKLDVPSRAAATAWAYEHDLAPAAYAG